MPASILVAAVIILGGSSLAAIVWLIADSGDRGRQRLAELERPAQPMAPAVTSQTPGVRDDPVPSITKLLGGTRAMEALQMELIRAGWMLRPSEFIAMCLGAAADAARLARWGATARHTPGVSPRPCPTWFPSKQQKRLKAISGQLPDAIPSWRAPCAAAALLRVCRSSDPDAPPVSRSSGVLLTRCSTATRRGSGQLVARTGSTTSAHRVRRADAVEGGRQPRESSTASPA